MVNTNSGINKNNSTENFSSEIISQKEIFKKNIEKLLNLKKFNIEEVFTRFLKMKISYFLQDNNFGFFKKYVEELEEEGQKSVIKENLNIKFEKYFPIHQEIFFKILNEEIESLEEKDEASIKNQIINFLEKYLHILFIFSEKIKLSDLEEYLKYDLTNLSLTYSSAKSDIILLDKFGTEIKNKLEKIFPGEEENFLMNEKFLPFMYRRLYREIEKSGETQNKGLEISKKIEEEYKKIFSEIFYIFETWIEFGCKNDEKLKSLEIFIRKLFEALIFLKNENIAFINFPAKNFSKNFINSLEKYVLDFLKESKSDYKEDFIIFLKNISELKENKDQKIENSEENARADLIKKIKEKQLENAKSRIPEDIEDREFIDINNITFEEWQQTPEQQRYDKVFSEVIGKNGKINLNEFLDLENEELINLYLKYYIKVRKIEDEESQKNFEKTIKNQIKKIKESNGETVEDFIKKDVNNLNTIILWYRFILRTRSLKEKGQELNIENLLKLKEKEYGIVEKISKRLRNKNLIPSEENTNNSPNKIIFSIDGKVRNTSTQMETIGLNETLTGIQRGFFKLENEKIKLTNSKEKLIRKIQDLYIPIGLTEKKNSKMEYDISDIDSHLRSGIDFCYSILKGEKIIKNTSAYNYGEILIEQEIIPENYYNLNLEEKERLQKLVEILKFIKSRLKILEGMMIVAQKDTDHLKKDNNLKNLLSKNQDSSFGPAKAFNRAFIKLIYEYSGNFNKIGDLTRARVVSKNLDESVEDIVKFIEICSKNSEITNISIVDSTGEPLSRPKKDSGYRDIKLFLKLKSGNTVEVQFQIEDMYQIKDNGIDLELEENNNIFKKMEDEGVLLTKNELENLLQIAKERDIILPTKNILMKMMENKEDKINFEDYEDILSKKQISTDYNYHIVRQLDEKSRIFKKLTRLERILADSAWSKIVLKYLKNKEIQVD